MSFVREHGLWNESATESARAIAQRIQSGEISKLRFAWADQHGLVRGKTLLGQRAVNALENGVGFVGTNLLKDTSDRTAWPVFTPQAGMGAPEFEGAADVLLVPDPTTFTELPWSPGSGWVLCQAYFADGRLVPYDTRGLLRRVMSQSLSDVQQYQIGLEVEFHIYRINDERLRPALADWPAPPPEVSLVGPGYRLLAEQRYDRIEPVLDLLREPLLQMGLPLESIEIELGPSQVEFVFGPSDVLQAADTMLLFRHASKQIMRRHGYMVTFMCRPALPNAMASGWHLHQSLLERQTGRNLFASDQPGNPAALSNTGSHFLGGLLANAAAATLFSTPTINGYRRYRPNMLAPDRINWGRDNRGALLRVVGSGAATRIENRGGEPAANPYLYMASQLACGMHGVQARSDAGAPADTPYDEAFALLPRSLNQALNAARENKVLQSAFGVPFMDYYYRLKQAEINRFDQQVTDWEQREYFELF